MKRLLLIVALVATGLSAKAQEVFNYGFETPSSELQVGKLEYINFLEGDTRDSVSTVSHKGNNALMLQNALVAGSNWQRALKFRNLPMESNTSYRVSFWVKGDANFTLPGGTATTSNIKASLMVGEENADVPYLAAENKPYEYTHNGFDANTWKKMNMVFFYTSDSIQKAYYASTKPEAAPLNIKHFLSLSVYNPGKYYIDDVVIKKSSIRSLQYNGDVIKVDFGYAVNGADLRTGKDYETASLPVESVKVTLDGAELVVEAVEVQPNGFFIFLATDYLDETAQSKLKVSFTNPVNSTVALKYTDGMRPFSWNPTFNMMVADFMDEEADHNIDLTGSSIIYYPPFLKSATPENESFDLPLITKTYNFVYSKKIDCSTAKAEMVGTAGKINMVLSETGFSETLTFNVPGAVNLTAGDYSITLSGIQSEKGIPADANDVLMFTLGTSGGGQSDTVFVDNYKEKGAGFIPVGWRFYSSANGNREGGTSQGSGPRVFAFSPTGNFNFGFYFRSTADNDNAGIQYGTYAANRLHLKPGKYMVSFYFVGWKLAEKSTFTVKDTLGNIAVTKEVSSPNNLGGVSGASKVVNNATLHEITFIVPTETDYILEWAVTGAWRELLLGKISMISVPSTAALYKGILSSALVVANSTLVMADSTLYDGSKKTALINTINQYKSASYTSPSEYKAAAAVVSAVTISMADHKTAVDNYFTNLALADSKLIANENTRYNKIQTFTKLGIVLEQYAIVDLEDDAKLKMASDSLYHYATTMQNWITNGIPAWKYRLDKAVVTAENLDVEGPEIQAAKDALTDDDELVAALNAKIKQYLHHNLALDLTKFGKSWEDSTLVDSLELTSFIKNPNFYSSQISNNLNSTTFPGWTTSNDISGGGMGATASATNPVLDTYATVFNQAINNFEQKVTGIPAGVYNIHMKTRTGDPTANGKTLEDINGVYYYYVVQGTDTLKTNFLIAAWGLPSTPTVIKNVKITDGTFTMGIHTGMVSGYTPSLFWGDAALYMVAKADGYTYTGLKNSQIGEAKVKEVQYFTLQGFRVSRISRGLYVVKTIYDNGTVDVKKIMIK